MLRDSVFGNTQARIEAEYNICTGKQQVVGRSFEDRVKATYLAAYKAAYDHCSKVFTAIDPQFTGFFRIENNQPQVISDFAEKMLIQMAGLLMVVDYFLPKSRFAPFQHQAPKEQWARAVVAGIQYCFRDLTFRPTKAPVIAPSAFITDEFLPICVYAYYKRSDPVPRRFFLPFLHTDDQIQRYQILNQVVDFVGQCIEAVLQDQDQELVILSKDLRQWYNVYDLLIDFGK